VSFGNTKPAPEDSWQNPGLSNLSAVLLETAVGLHDPILRDPQKKSGPVFRAAPNPNSNRKISYSIMFSPESANGNPGQRWK
jgi:hypothetical protein